MAEAHFLRVTLHISGFVLYLAIAPKLRVPAFLLALLVSVTRVAVNDHYVSDVCASAAIAAFVSCAYATLVVQRKTRDRSGSKFRHRSVKLANVLGVSRTAGPACRSQSVMPVATDNVGSTDWQTATGMTP